MGWSGRKQAISLTCKDKSCFARISKKVRPTLEEKLRKRYLPTYLLRANMFIIKTHANIPLSKIPAKVGIMNQS